MVREAFFDFDGCGTPISSISLSYRQFAQLRFDSGVQRATIRQMPREERRFSALLRIRQTSEGLLSLPEGIRTSS